MPIDLISLASSPRRRAKSAAPVECVPGCFDVSSASAPSASNRTLRGERGTAASLAPREADGNGVEVAARTEYDRGRA